jgi:hypothetical protein
LKKGHDKLAINLFGKVHGIHAKVPTAFGQTIKGFRVVNVEHGLDAQVHESQ